MTSNMNHFESIGELIRKYRLEKGLSQLDLETGIEAAVGSIAKIEIGEINPSKEILRKIIEFLDLPSDHAQSLFNIDMSFLGSIIEQLHKLKDVKDLDGIMSIAMNEVRLQLGLSGGALYLIEDNHLCLRAIASTYFMSIVRRIVIDPFDLLRFNLETHHESMLVQSILENKTIITSNVYDLAKPLVNKWIVDRIQKITFTKQIAVIPIISRGEVVGLVTYGSLTGNDFRFEIEPLKIFVAEVGKTLEKLLPLNKQNFKVFPE